MASPTLRCSVLAVGDFPEGGATSQRLYLLTRILNEGLGDASLWIMHPGSKVPIQENSSIDGEWQGVKFSYLSGSTVRPKKIGGALVDTIRGIYRCISLIVARGDQRPDVLILYTPTFMKFIIPVLVARLFRVPLLIEACEIQSISTSVQGVGALRRFAKSGQSIMENITPAISDGLISISKGISQYYEKLGQQREAVYLLPVLIDRKFYEDGGQAAVPQLKGKNFLLNSGSFREKDGLEFLIKAVVKAHDEYPDLKLVFTGGVSESIKTNILNNVNSIDKDWIIFTGYLSRDELIWCYKNAAGLLCCRSNSEYANYGFPTKLAEYLGSGRPVIATTVGDVEMYLKDGETAFLAIPEDSESIYRAIQQLMFDPVHAEQVGRNGAEVARQHFDYKVHVKQLAAFIRQRVESAHSK